MVQEFTKSSFELSVDDTIVEISAIHRSGRLAPLVFLHGFGSTKEDYADIVRHSVFDGHPFMAYDAPGCGQSQCADLAKISIPFLVQVAISLLEQFRIERFHLIGHSMGGLTALMLAQEFPERIISFINIEGNISPEDCFLSRQVIEYPHTDPNIFFDQFIERTRHAPAYASALYAASLPHKVRAGAVSGIFRSMVELSDHGDLMEKFLNLPHPKMFMYGEQNAYLSYLQQIKKHGIRLSQIPNCGHFPMYSNPLEMWQHIASFIDSTLHRERY
jgi:pimeloyl-ACP methyl ester carboxylesterase